MKTGFLGGAYTSRSPILASQTAINIYPELVEASGSEIGGFYGTPGRQSVFQGNGEVRGLWVTTGGIPGYYRLFAVIGSTAYRLDSNYNATVLGTLPNISLDAYRWWTTVRSWRSPIRTGCTGWL